MEHCSDACLIACIRSRLLKATGVTQALPGWPTQKVCRCRALTSPCRQTDLFANNLEDCIDAEKIVRPQWSAVIARVERRLRDIKAAVRVKASVERKNCAFGFAT